MACSTCSPAASADEGQPPDLTHRRSMRARRSLCPLQPKRCGVSGRVASCGRGGPPAPRAPWGAATRDPRPMRPGAGRADAGFVRGCPTRASCRPRAGSPRTAQRGFRLSTRCLGIAAGPEWSSTRFGPVTSVCWPTGTRPGPVRFLAPRAGRRRPRTPHRAEPMRHRSRELRGGRS